MRPRTLRSVLGHRNLPLLIAAPGIAALLGEPLVWLLGNWFRPIGTSGAGLVIAALCASLAVRSVRSGPSVEGRSSRRLAMALVLGAAALRLLGRLISFNSIGALALGLDVLALALALELARRPEPVQPLALTFLFWLSFPVERWIQRLFGQPLRLLAAEAAARVLGPWFDGVTHHGAILAWRGVELEIDLPCTGTSGLVLLCALAAAVACRRRTGFFRLLGLGYAIAIGAFVANTLRIVLLFCGAVAGIGVFTEPWHSMLGLVTLALGATPVFWVARRLPPLERAISHPRAEPVLSSELSASLAIPAVRDQDLRLSPPSRRWLRCGGAAAFSTAACLIALTPRHVIDGSRSDFSIRLPANLGGWAGVELPATEQELEYFGVFGGSVSRRAYRLPGEVTHTVLLVTSSAPLRHLHEPVECLTNAGYRLESIPGRFERFPTVSWKATGPDETTWRVDVSFVSSRGEGVSRVSDVVWSWLHHPEDSWSLLERISPWDSCNSQPSRCLELDRVLFGALDLHPFAETTP